MFTARIADQEIRRIIRDFEKDFAITLEKEIKQQKAAWSDDTGLSRKAMRVRRYRPHWVGVFNIYEYAFWNEYARRSPNRFQLFKFVVRKLNRIAVTAWDADFRSSVSRVNAATAAANANTSLPGHRGIGVLFGLGRR